MSTRQQRTRRRRHRKRQAALGPAAWQRERAAKEAARAEAAAAAERKKQAERDAIARDPRLAARMIERDRRAREAEEKIRRAIDLENRACDAAWARALAAPSSPVQELKNVGRNGDALRDALG